MMTVTNNTVGICLAAYNGEQFIEEQIASVIRQTYTDWVLFIRDDGSADKTPEILRRIAGEEPEKIVLIDDETLTSGSSCTNFMSILKWVSERFDFEYFMFSDQDDVWLEDKIERCMQCIRQAEKEAAGPILVHTDLMVVDRDLKVIDKSFFSYRSLESSVNDLRHLLVHNNVTGCTMLWNKALNELIDKDCADMVIHDWWVSLTASALGRILFVDTPTILYRQHGGNVLGAVKTNSLSFIAKRLRGVDKVRQTLRASMVQAGAFLEIHRSRLSVEQVHILSEYAGLMRHCKLKRVIIAVRESFLKQGLINKIGELIFI